MKENDKNYFENNHSYNKHNDSLISSDQDEVNFVINQNNSENNLDSHNRSESLNIPIEYIKFIKVNNSVYTEIFDFEEMFICKKLYYNQLTALVLLNSFEFQLSNVNYVDCLNYKEIINRYKLIINEKSVSNNMNIELILEILSKYIYLSEIFVINNESLKLLCKLIYFYKTDSKSNIWINPKKLTSLDILKSLMNILSPIKTIQFEFSEDISLSEELNSTTLFSILAHNLIMLFSNVKTLSIDLSNISNFKCKSIDLFKDSFSHNENSDSKNIEDLFFMVQVPETNDDLDINDYYDKKDNNSGLFFPINNKINITFTSNFKLMTYLHILCNLDLIKIFQNLSINIPYSFRNEIISSFLSTYSLEKHLEFMRSFHYLSFFGNYDFSPISFNFNFNCFDNLTFINMLHLLELYTKIKDVSINLFPENLIYYNKDLLVNNSINGLNLDNNDYFHINSFEKFSLPLINDLNNNFNYLCICIYKKLFLCEINNLNISLNLPIVLSEMNNLNIILFKFCVNLFRIITYVNSVKKSDNTSVRFLEFHSKSTIFDNNSFIDEIDIEYIDTKEKKLRKKNKNINEETNNNQHLANSLEIIKEKSNILLSGITSQTIEVSFKSFFKFDFLLSKDLEYLDISWLDEDSLIHFISFVNRNSLNNLRYIKISLSCINFRHNNNFDNILSLRISSLSLFTFQEFELNNFISLFIRIIESKINEIKIYFCFTNVIISFLLMLIKYNVSLIGNLNKNINMSNSFSTSNSLHQQKKIRNSFFNSIFKTFIGDEKNNEISNDSKSNNNMTVSQTLLINDFSKFELKDIKLSKLKDVLNEDRNVKKNSINEKINYEKEKHSKLNAITINYGIINILPCELFDLSRKKDSKLDHINNIDVIDLNEIEISINKSYNKNFNNALAIIFCFEKMKANKINLIHIGPLLFKYLKDKVVNQKIHFINNKKNK